MEKMKQRHDYFINDDITITSYFNYDYSFCNSNCKNYQCGRNSGSKSFRKMVSESDAPIVYTVSDFSSACQSFRKREE